ncbi:MAG: hypothetical protein SPL47_07590 [Bacteroidales bacterium]|nr:hypothetical protein [Bacteroidales bacterium]
MQITSTGSRTSGNRRSGDNQEGVEGSATGGPVTGQSPLEPRASVQPLRYSAMQPMKPIPSIGGVVMQSQSLVQNNMQAATPSPVAEGSVPKQEETSAADNPSETGETQAEPEPEKSFSTCWMETVDALFSKKPAFYHQLKEYLPDFKDGVITVDVENEFQKKHLEAAKNSIITFWNEKHSSKISDVEFVIREHERKKMIYTTDDKVRNMMEQNPELKDFLQILNFRVKD